MYEIVLPIGVKHGKVAAPTRSREGMQRVNEPQQPEGSGWTAAKVLGVIFGLLLMVGFGVCGLCGMLFYSSPTYRDPGILGLSLAGFAIATVGFFIVRAMVRSARRGR
jgi:hypothetical protein